MFIQDQFAGEDQLRDAVLYLDQVRRYFGLHGKEFDHNQFPFHIRVVGIGLFKQINGPSQRQVGGEAAIPIPSSLSSSRVFDVDHRKSWGQASTGDNMFDGEGDCALVLEVRDLTCLDIDGTHDQMNGIAIEPIEIDQITQSPAKRCNLIDASLQEWSQEWGIDIRWAESIHGRVDEQ